MKKKEKVICIEQNKASIIGMIMSLIFSIIVAYGSAAIIIKEWLADSDISISSLGGLLQPILFIIFGVFILAFIIICSTQNNKK